MIQHSFVKIQLGKKETQTGKKPHGQYRPTYILAVTHGSGGGLTGSAVNRNERYGYALSGIDALIVGHHHKPFATQPGRICVDAHNNKVSIKPFRVISATSWLEYGGYAAAKMLLPTTHCLQTLTLCGNHKEMSVTM